MLNRTLFTGVLTPSVVQEVILAAAGNLVPILALVGGAASLNDPRTGQVIPISRATGNAEVKWFTSNLGARRMQINNGGTAYDAATTTLVVDDSAIFSPNQVLLAEATGEKMLVMTVPSGTQITVKRAYGSTAAAAGSVANNAWLRVLAIAQGEGGDWAESRHTGKTEVNNYCQIFQEAVEITGTLLRSSTLTEDEQAFQRMMAFRRFVENIERSLLFGEKTFDKTDAAGRIARTMAGLYQSINTNVTNVAGAMSLAAFESAVRPAFDSSPGPKIGFAGATVVGALRDIYKTHIRTVTPTQRVGFKVSEIETSFGQLQLVYHAGLSAPYAGDMVIVDPSQVELRHLEGGNATGEHPGNGRIQLWRPNRGDGDRTKEVWFAELTNTWGDETAHARLTGVTGAA
jgi:hypothetical protein